VRGKFSRKIEQIIMEAMDGTGRDWRLRAETAMVVSAALKAVEEVEDLVIKRSTRKNCSDSIK
jgi:hypothetical protein